LDKELIAIADLWLAEGFTAPAGELGFEIAWLPDVQ
jgi:hypothetical protein